MKIPIIREHRAGISLALLALFFAAGVGAIEPGLPSKTSIMVTADRAFASHDPDPSIRNPDWLAEQFLGPRERAEIPDNASIKALTLPYDEGLKLVAGISRMTLIRTRFIDERLQKAVEDGAKQVIILGAGFDSRAYRMRSILANTRVIEVDYGPTQEYKKRRVLEVLGGFPPNLTFAPIDFTKDKLDVVLHKAGYRDNQKTFVVWEGVTYYIPEDAVRSTMGVLSKLAAPGSQIVLDYMNHTFVFGDPSAPPRTTQPGFPQWGEPWIFGIPDGTEQQFFSEGGYALGDKASVTGNDPDVAKLYLTRRDGTIYGGPITTRSGWWIAELTVSKQSAH